MGEGDCVKILEGEYVGKIGIITLIDGKDYFVSIGDSDPEIFNRSELQYVECPED